MLGGLLFFYGWLVLHRELLKGWLVVFLDDRPLIRY